MRSDRVRQHRALTDQKLAAAMQHQCRLLLLRLRRHEPHRRSCNRLADGGRVVGVVLAALEISLHVARWHQPHCVAKCLKLTAPMVCGWTRLNADQAGRQSREELQHLRSADAFTDQHCAIDRYTVNLKNRLRYIKTNRANVAHGRLPSLVVALVATTFGTSMP